MSKFVECVVLATVLLVGASIISYCLRLSRRRGESSRLQRFRKAFELRTIVLVMLIPMFYLGFHHIPFSWLLWVVLAVVDYVALYGYISNARKRARHVKSGQPN